MRTPLARLALAAALALCLPLPAAATIKPQPVRLKHAGPAPVLRPGEPFTLSLELESKVDVQVSGLRAESASLQKAFARPAAPMRVAPGAPARFELELLPSAAPAPIQVEYEVNGVTESRTIDLASRMESEIAKRSAMVQVSADPGPQMPAQLLAEADSVRRARQASGQGGTLIFFSGTLVYTRPGNGGTIPPMDIGAHGVRVSLMDEDYGPDDELVSTFTGPDGRFNYYAYWDGQIGEGDPELYIKFETDHPWVVVQDGFWDVEYSWNTATQGSSTADLHIGTYRPSDLSTHPALHIATNIAHNHQWYDDYPDYFVPSVDVKWPEGATGAYFDPFFEQIHIGVDREWNEATHAHEYGHFFVHTFAADDPPSYCNGFCDTPDCGHCIWCPEGASEAFSEGWPNWIAHVQISSYFSIFGVAPVFTRNSESIQQCGVNGVTWADPEITEGTFGAVLQDIWDSGPGTDDADPNRLIPGVRDRLQLGFDEIFTVLDLDEPRTSRTFMNAFVNRFPQYRYALWETAMNSRWNLDVSPPGAPSNVTSSSHPIGTPTANLNIALAWTQPGPDDWSGIRGYSIRFAASPQAPDDTIEVHATGSYLSDDLPAGTWYATVRTVDVSGRVSTTYATAGPFVVQAPTPVDLAPYTPAGWSRPLVARATGDATTGFAPDPLALTGNATAYINVAGRNQGQSTYQGIIPARSSLFVDGSLFHFSGNVFPAAPGATFAHLNVPVSVRGGRHMVGSIFDAFGFWFEGNEVNNYWSRAFVWGGLGLVPNTPLRRVQAPPIPDGSWSGVFDGSLTFYNCDGFSFTSSGFWNAVWVAADADSEDYSIRLHNSSSGTIAGYDYVLASSDKPAGYLEALLVNRNTMGQVTWNAGVIGDLIDTHDGKPHSPFVVKHTTSTTFPWADTLNVAFADSEYVVMREVFVPQAGPVATTVWADSSGGPVHVSWLDRTYTRGALDAPVWTWPEGKVTLSSTATASGYHCIVLHRDPKDGRGARTVQLGVGVAPVDLQAFVPAGWSGAAVPRPTADANTSSVPAPDTLHGGVGTTYMNLAYRNQSPSATGVIPLGIQLSVNGATVSTIAAPALAANGSAMSINSGPFNLPGGRHLFAVRLDHGNLFDESEEANNGSGEQWVWSPVALTLGSGQTGPMPPDPVGGFASFTGTGSLFYNCLGYRAVLPGASGLWGGVGLVPVDSTDSDLRLHDPAPGTRNAFGASLGISTWGPYDSDYLIVRHDGTRTLDASVIRGDDGAPGGFDISSTGASALTTLPVSTADQFIGPSDVLRLHPVTLPAGYVRVRLTHISGGIDWGVSLHGDSLRIQGKSQAVDARWLEGAAQGEEFIAFVPAADTFVVAVWKRGGADRGQFGVYRLQLDAMALDAPGGSAPVATRLGALRPAPFRDRTALSFDLATSGEASVEVFDVRGARVRTLAGGVRAAGRHEVEWRGDDDHGRRLPAGIYLVRMKAGSFSAQSKVVRLD